LAVALGFGGTAQAATVVGSPLTASDINTLETCLGGECTQWNDTLPGATLTTPAGVVTAFTVRSAVAIQARVRVLRGPVGATTVVASTPFASIAGTNSAEEIDARLAVNAGDIVAISFPPANDPPYAATGGSTGRCFNRFASEPADGATNASEACTTGRELLYNATVEADADGDGYGDESQDLCPTNAGPQACPVADPAPVTPAPASPAPAPAAPDAKAPVIGGLSLLNAVFRVDKTAASALTETPRGTAFRFSLSEAATVTITIEQRSDGRRVSGSCRKTTTRNTKRKPCVRYVPLRTFERPGSAGANSISFGGRILVGGVSRMLRPARYRALIKARDTAGNVSVERQTAFRVVR
jgi:hypothetical protein